MSARILSVARDRHFADPGAKRVIELLAEEVDDDGAGIFPVRVKTSGRNRLLLPCGLRLDTIQKVLRQARDAGLLTILPGRGGVLHLRLDLDALLAQPLTEAGRRRFLGSGGMGP